MGGKLAERKFVCKQHNIYAGYTYLTCIRVGCRFCLMLQPIEVNMKDGVRTHTCPIDQSNTNGRVLCRNLYWTHLAWLDVSRVALPRLNASKVVSPEVKLTPLRTASMKFGKQLSSAVLQQIVTTRRVAMGRTSLAQNSPVLPLMAHD